MNEKQAIERIKELFQSLFDRGTYTLFLRNLLNQFEERSNHHSGNTVPELTVRADDWVMWANASVG